MDKVKIPEDIINDVEEIIGVNGAAPEEKVTNIIFDGRQYTLKIPKRIADKVGIIPGKDKFIFSIKTYPLEEKKKPDLVISLNRGE